MIECRADYLSPLQCEILMMLEEAGAETVGTVTATITPADRSDFVSQVNGLVTLGLIRKEEDNLVLTEQGRIALRTYECSIGQKSRFRSDYRERA